MLSSPQIRNGVTQTLTSHGYTGEHCSETIGASVYMPLTGTRDAPQRMEVDWGLE